MSFSKKKKPNVFAETFFIFSGYLIMEVNPAFRGQTSKTRRSREAAILTRWTVDQDVPFHSHESHVYVCVYIYIIHDKWVPHPFHAKFLSATRANTLTDFGAFFFSFVQPPAKKK